MASSASSATTSGARKHAWTNCKCLVRGWGLVRGRSNCPYWPKSQWLQWSIHVRLNQLLGSLVWRHQTFPFFTLHFKASLRGSLHVPQSAGVPNCSWSLLTQTFFFLLLSQPNSIQSGVTRSISHPTQKLTNSRVPGRWFFQPN